jgi:dihydropyrimidine dehydrogenase (NAD+) subunit PreA
VLFNVCLLKGELQMANLRTNFLGVEIKNPVGVTSCDFGGNTRLAKRVIDQGIGWLVGKTVHKIDGPHRWPRPYFYSLKKFGPELRDSWTCSQMFHNMPYEQWLETEGPATLKLCRENDCLFIPSVSGIGTDPDTWIPFCKDMENMGCDMIELDTGGPHATFGAVAAHKDVGAPLAMDPDTAYKVTKACVDAVKIPIIFKMTPQCVNMAALALAVERAGAAGISANNAFYGTWIDHETASFYGGPFSCGGSMGRSWQLFSLAKVLEITATVKIPVIGIGGIFTWDDCVRYMMGGCRMSGFCSSLYSRGVGILKEAIDGISAFMDRKGYKSVDEFIGVCVPEFSYIRDWPKEEAPMKYPSPIIPVFDLEKCNNCGICEKLCPYGAVEIHKNKGPIINEHCMGCAWCQGHCPKDAVTMILKETGETIWNGRGLPSKWCK